MAASDPPWAVTDPGSAALVLRVHVQPGAKRTEVAGIHGDRLKIRLGAPPVDGKANALLIAFLAGEFGVQQRSVELLSGASSRQKTLRIVGAARRPDRAWATL